MKLNAPERSVSRQDGRPGGADEEEGIGRGSDTTADLPPASRMAMGLLALVGLLIASYMLLYKLGMIGSLACGTGSCGAVQASKWATFLGMPVPAWGVAGYALILILSLVGLQPRWAHDRHFGMVLFGLATVAFTFSAYLTAIEAFVIYAWCRWCVASAIVATLIFICALAEFRRRGEV